MNNSLSSRDLEVKYAGVAIEYGTLTLLIDTVVQQPVLVMPLERSIQYGSVTVFQWMIHITTRLDMNSPVTYATFQTAQVKQTALAQTLTFPPQEEWLVQPKEHAHKLQQQVLVCVTDLLKRSFQVSQVIVPARYRLPNEWVWSARCQDHRIAYWNGSWMLVEEDKLHA